MSETPLGKTEAGAFGGHSGAVSGQRDGGGLACFRGMVAHSFPLEWRK